MENHFAVRLAGAVRRCGNPVLVGLDPRARSLPAGLLPDQDLGQPERVAAAYGEFCRGVIDVVAPLVAVVKPQAAFFEQQGPAGMAVLSDVIAYARGQGLLVILDGKRNDIGSTATAYAHAYLGPAEQHGWGADALTVSPYLGEDSIEPFVEVASENGGGVFVLVKTSNPGGGRFQDLVADGRTLHEHVGELVEQLASQTLPGEETGCAYGSVGAVAGATYPEQLAEIRQSLPHCWLLVPGFGAQGGGAADVAGAFDESGLGAIVNSSRGIIFAHARDPYQDRFGDARWQDAVEAATHEMISQLRDLTPAGQLAE
ncbi:MAG: orotidine-5'-phosphate decarboxylase [Planctomycetota bacterium]|nr:orotidine-5'-phosphate decarboxylase [Planctomycetota bacterium]